MSSVAGAAELVKRLGGVQAQELASALLGLRARSGRLTADDVKKAREAERSIVLTWAMRGTMHLVAAEDLGWMLAWFGPLFIHESTRRYAQLGLDAVTRAKAVRIMREALGEQGPLARPALAAILADHDIPVEGQAIAHLVRAAALEGVICYGPERDGELTYVALEDWVRVDSRFDRAHASVELARRYFGGYGPATIGDFVTWAGIPLPQARAAVEAMATDLVAVALPDGDGWMLKQHISVLDQMQGDDVVRLLPRYDAYLLGYQKRDWMVDAAYAKRIHPGGGLIHPAVIAAGRAVGIWRQERKRTATLIVVEPFETLDAPVQASLEAEAQDIGRFLGQEVRLSTADAL